MIDFDQNATTKPGEAVIASMVRALSELWHNPSSVHRAGQEARHALELARQQVAALIGAKPKHLTFTSGGTESVHMLIDGVLRAQGHTGRRVIVTSKIEHSAVRELAEELEARGVCEVRWLKIDAGGVVSVQDAARQIDSKVAVVSVQWANNETGVVQPVEAIGKLARAAGAVMHTDATQWVGKMQTDVGVIGSDEAIGGWCDAMSFSAHKFYGPKGVGMLWARPGVRMRAMLVGTQETGRRGGTENVPGIVGAGVAAMEAREWLEDSGQSGLQAKLRDELERGIVACCSKMGLRAVVNGADQSRLWNTTNIGFDKKSAEGLLLALSERGLCASAGTACSSGSLEPSPVLLAMGVPETVAFGSIRFSIGKQTTQQDIDQGLGIIEAVLRSQVD